MGSCLDLRKYQDGESLEEAFGKIVSGKSGYRPVLERRIDPVRCKQCNKLIEDGNTKFCPVCGSKVERKPTSIKCPKCTCLYNENDVFCGECGNKRE